METQSTNNSHMQEKDPIIVGKLRKEQIEWLLILFFILGYVAVALAQGTPLGSSQEYTTRSTFEGKIKDAVKFSDQPEIKDTVKKIENIKYGIVSTPIISKYETQKIEPAKLQNEPLPKIYHSLFKIGYGVPYNMPLAELFVASTRAKEASYGLKAKHLSSTNHLRDVGYGGFSDNAATAFAKRFYKKHTLTGDLNYERNVLHYYGYDTTLNHLNDDYTKQRYQLFEPKLQLVSHYTDSTHINHNIQLSYYNYQNIQQEIENNVKLAASGSMFINKEKLNVGFLTDYYNNKQAADTFNNAIFSLNPSFEANGKKWHADMGLIGTLDQFKGVARFYFYPQLNVHYDVYNSIIIPYAGVNGGLQKNSFKTLSRENPFIDTTFNYQNTSKKYDLFAGLRGNLSSNTSYDAKFSYAAYDNMHFFVMDYSSPVQLYNRFDVIYDNATLMTVSGQLKYQLREKLNLVGKGNYYIYSTKTITRAYHKPDFDLTFSGIYNLQSKIIIRADLFFMGQQWGYTPNAEGSLQPKIIKGWADINFEGEYRYSKTLSFFARLNNLANSRYYRWERYPSQRFGFMLGLSFVPF